MGSSNNNNNNNNNNKLLFFFFTICIGVTLALLSPTTTTAAAENDVVVAENLRLKSELSQLATSLLSHRFHLLLLKGKFFVLDYSIKEAIIEFKADDERINKLLGNFLLLSEFCQHKLENVIQENNATIASLLKNTEATHAAESKNEGDFVSTVKKAEGLVRDISEKAFVLSKEAPKRANTFDKQHIGLSEKVNLFDRVIAKYGKYLGLKSKENVKEEKEGNDQIHEF